MPSDLSDELSSSALSPVCSEGSAEIFTVRHNKKSEENTVSSADSFAKNTHKPAAGISAAPNTPMMAQYCKIKAENADFLLFYRMGDFYELFFEDALIASKTLDIVLTARGKANGEDIPMCGVPVHAAEDYLQKLIAAGHRIAVCEQMEDPAAAKKRGAKSVVRREVVRRVTPGTITEEKLLAPERANYLMALVQNKKRPVRGKQNLSDLLPQETYFPDEDNALFTASEERSAEDKTSGAYYALAWIDISTGIFRVSCCDEKRLLADILRIEPQELLLSESLYHDDALRPLWNIIGKAVTPQPESLFGGAQAEKRICDYYNIATAESFAAFNKAELKAVSAVLAYVEKTQIHEKPPLQRPMREDGSEHIFIDAATAANLELLRTQNGKSEGSLLKSVNRTLTGSGARLLAERLSMPLNRAEAIEDRLDSVSYFLQEPHYRHDLRENLTGLADIMRALSRLVLARGGPRDFAAILHALETAADICHCFALADLPHELFAAKTALEDMPQAWRQKLKAALADDLPLLRRDGGFIRKGYHAKLDEARSLKTETHRVIAAMQQQLAQETGIKNLKIKHNNILGFFIEVTTAQAAPLLETETAKARFIHRQSMANAMRFTTSELADLESRINSAASIALAIELQIFEELTQDIKSYADDLREGAAALAAFDVAAALAVLAEEQNYCRPKIDNGLQLAIKGGRHPVVEQALRTQAEDPFIPNNCDLSPPSALSAAQTKENQIKKAGGIWLLTGPNMGGKSTFLRQNALIVLLAQMGSYVPAESAHIGLVDRLFSRVGASDDLARGRSTFMVEMVETATILNQATAKSLVILDEIGRGTATFDGLSIAWAALEYLHNVNCCRALFATHFHELTALSQNLPRLSNHSMRVSEWNNQVIFLHEVGEGSADRSYGIQVAQLAGLPQEVTARAREVLDRLEQHSLTASAATVLQDLPLFRTDIHRSGADAAYIAPSTAQMQTPPTHESQQRAAQTSPVNNLLQAADKAAQQPAAAQKQGESGTQDSAPKNNAAAAFSAAEKALLQAIAALDPDILTPRAALDEIYKLKALLKK